MNHRAIGGNHLWQALARVDLESFVRRLPAGLDTILDEDGHNFSGGQRARLSLARALLLDRPILLLDEPLANIDEQSQHIFLNALEQIRRHKTCLVISHLPAVMARADQLLKLENGICVQQSISATGESDGQAGSRFLVLDRTAACGR